MEIKNRIFAILLLCIAASSCIKAKLEEAYNKQDTQIDSYVNSYITSNTKTFDETIIDTLGFHTQTVTVYDTTYVTGTNEYGEPEETMKIDSTERIDTVYETVSRDTSWTVTPRVVHNNGSARLVKKEGEGPDLKPDGSVSFYYAGYIFSGRIDRSGLFTTNHQVTAESNGFNLTDPDYSLYEVNLGETELLKGLHYGLIGVKAGEECDILFNGKDAFGNSTFGMIPANSALAFQIWVVSVSND